jgi:hypothetical protein
MEQEHKELLLKDLCGRLPYGVILECCEIVGEQLRSIDDKGLINNDYDIDEVKPLLFPISSMTEEQKKDMIMSSVGIGSDKNVFDWYNKNHFDWRGLIPKGLAEDATGRNIY